MGPTAGREPGAGRSVVVVILLLFLWLRSVQGAPTSGALVQGVLPPAPLPFGGLPGCARRHLQLYTLVLRVHCPVPLAAQRGLPALPRVLAKVLWDGVHPAQHEAAVGCVRGVLQCVDTMLLLVLRTGSGAPLLSGLHRQVLLLQLQMCDRFARSAQHLQGACELLVLPRPVPLLAPLGAQPSLRLLWVEAAQAAEMNCMRRLLNAARLRAVSRGQVRWR